MIELLIVAPLLTILGVHKLPKKLRPADKTPDEFASSDVLHGKSIGIDLSVVLHKGLGTKSGAAEEPSGE